MKQALTAQNNISRSKNTVNGGSLGKMQYSTQVEKMVLMQKPSHIPVAPDKTHFSVRTIVWSDLGLLAKWSLLSSRDKGLLLFVFFKQIVLTFFLFCHNNIGCGYPLKVFQRCASNEYPQHKFSLRNKKKNVYLTPHLIYSYTSTQ